MLMFSNKPKYYDIFTIFEKIKKIFFIKTLAEAVNFLYSSRIFVCIFCEPLVVQYTFTTHFGNYAIRN